MIRIENLSVSYNSAAGEVQAVRGVDIDIAAGQFYTLLGPSGCGKTTTLRCIAGLEQPTDGTITINGQVVFSARRQVMVPPYKRDIGMVFQSYAIWPHLNVFENVAFPLREMRPRLSRKQIRDKVMNALTLVQLESFADRPAPFLSGGQQQRLALARAIVREPKVLLLDEPLSNLDAKLREATRTEIRELVKRLGITTVYVTHDQLEALTMSDVIAVMQQGRIVQEGTPATIYGQPKERFVADFIGLSNFVEGRVAALPKNGNAIGTVDTASGSIRCLLPEGAALGGAVILVLRPEDMQIVASRPDAAENVVEGRVLSTIYMGDATECQVALKDTTLRLKLHPTTKLSQGDPVLVTLPAERCRALIV
jgi:iron(III) transport system ATP-binding protein